MKYLGYCFIVVVKMAHINLLLKTIYQYKFTGTGKAKYIMEHDDDII